MTSQITKDANNIYYDCVIPNHGATGYIPATYTEEKLQNIVDKGSDYQMSVIRFSIPGYTLPIRIVETFGDPTLPNKLAYSVTLTDSAGHSSGQVYLTWAPEEQFPVPISVDSSNIYSFQYYSLFSFRFFMDIVNAAFATAFTALVANGYAGAATTPPYLTYNPSTQLFSLVAQQNYVNVPSINIFMNQKLFLFFNSFNNKFFPNATNGQDYQLLFKYEYDNSAGLTGADGYFTQNQYIAPRNTPAAGLAVFNLDQDFSTLGNWNGVKTIVFTTGIIAIRKEFTSTLDQSGNQNTIPIVTDFIPISSNGTENRTDIVYNPTAEYRMIDIVTPDPIRKFQISLFWQDNHLNIYPIYIAPADVVSLKILFRRKRL